LLLLFLVQEDWGARAGSVAAAAAVVGQFLRSLETLERMMEIRLANPWRNAHV
jgi:hypothetical protein